MSGEPVGIDCEEPNELYHSREAVSNTKLKTANKSLALYHKKYIAKTIPETTSDALAFGIHGHCYILEGPEAFERQFTVMPEGGFPLNTNKGKDGFCEFVEDAFEEGRIPQTEADVLWRLIREPRRSADEKNMMARIVADHFVTHDNFQTILRAKQALDSSPTAKGLLAACQSEVSFRTDTSSYGMQLQCRADGYSVQGCEFTKGKSFVVDFKTIDDLDNAENNFNNFGYYRQGPFYANVINSVSKDKPIHHFFFIFVEKKEPYRCRVFESEDEAWEYGLKEIESDLTLLSQAYKGETPWMDRDYGLLGLKPWTKKRINERIFA